MKLALCNEVIADRRFAEQCELAADLGYDGLEVAPFTLGESPHLLSEVKRAAIRTTASNAGIAITGLHFLLLAPEGLSLVSGDASVRARTADVIERLVGLCADLGGSVLVHGSPAQRRIPDGVDPADARSWALATFTRAAGAAESAGVTYCLEPLARTETNFVNTVLEAATIVAEIGSPAFRTMIDTSAADEGVPSESV